MMDSLMNAPLLYWASTVTGNKDYWQAAHDHVKTTADLLIREDGSSFHHYQFDPKTAGPVGGLTFQGHANDSCWSRGHAWGVYGFPIAYSYDKSEFIKEVHRDVAYFMLNHLPADFVPYWDYDFVEGDEPRDASAGVISACGLYEMARNLPEGDADKRIFESAANQLLEAVIDNCTDGIGEYDDGLICHVTAALPQRLGIDQTAVYGDYFYLEALARALNPDFKMYW
jgi:unsaturated chondroitin disaccharide hydrolase